MSNFTPISALIGGIILGLSSSLLLWMNGRVAGVSGIFGGMVVPRPKEFAWRAVFIAGLVAGGMLMARLMPGSIAYDVDRSYVLIIVAGLLVGFGTRWGNGCTSGHGICGLSRLSTRSLVSVITFIATGGIAVFLTTGGPS